MWNVLIKVGKIIKKFYDFYFSSCGWKFIENWGHFEYKNDNNSKKKKIAKSKIWFFFHFSRIRIFHVNFKIFEEFYFFVRFETKNYIFFFFKKFFLGYYAETPLTANLFQLVSAIQKHAGYSGRIHEKTMRTHFLMNIRCWRATRRYMPVKYLNFVHIFLIKCAKLEKVCDSVKNANFYEEKKKNLLLTLGQLLTS